MAGRQHGIVTRRDLLRLGFSPEAIEHRIAKGRLHPVTRGVYAVGWPHLTRERRWMAAVLACGERAALSHHSAAAFWGIGEERRGQIDVSVRRRCKHRRAGIRAMGRPSLPREDVVLRNDIPVTSPARTLLDLATELGTTALERLISEADNATSSTPKRCAPRSMATPGNQVCGGFGHSWTSTPSVSTTRPSSGQKKSTSNPLTHALVKGWGRPAAAAIGRKRTSRSESER